MGTVTLILDLDDVMAGLRAASYTVSTESLAEKLRHYAEILTDEPALAVAADWTGAYGTEARSAFEAQNFTLIEGRSGRPETLRSLERYLYESLLFDPAQQYLLVTGDVELRPVAESIARSQHEIRIWGPKLSTPETLRTPPFSFKPLEEILKLQARAVSVALLLDVENIFISLVRQGYQVNPELIAAACKQKAAQLGPVEAYAYADWSKLPPMRDGAGNLVTADAQRLFEKVGIRTRYLVSEAGKNSADMQIADDVRSMMERRDGPDVVILASGDRDFRPLLETLARQRKRTIVWGIAGATSVQLNAYAQVEYLDQFVELVRVEPSVASEDAAELCKPLPWGRFVLRVEEVMRRNRWQWVFPNKLALELEHGGEPSLNDFPGGIRAMIGQAIDMDLLVRERMLNPNPALSSDYVWVLRVSGDHTAVRAARLISTRVPALMRQVMSTKGFEYVTPYYLQRGMSQDRVLSQPWLVLDEAARLGWIDILVSEGFLRAERRPNSLRPGETVTALSLPATGWIARTPSTATGYSPVQRPTPAWRETENWRGPSTVSLVNSETNEIVPESRPVAVDSSEDMRKRIIVNVDHYQRSRGWDWTPLKGLNQRLSLYGGREFVAALRELQDEGVVQLKEHPNPIRPIPTRGVHLNYDSEVVTATLAIRDVAVKAIYEAGAADMAQTRSELIQALEQQFTSEHVAEDANLWLKLLEGEHFLIATEDEELRLDGHARVVQSVLRNVGIQVNSEHETVNNTYDEQEGNEAPSRSIEQGNGIGSYPTLLGDEQASEDAESWPIANNAQPEAQRMSAQSEGTL